MSVTLIFSSEKALGWIATYATKMALGAPVITAVAGARLSTPTSYKYMLAAGTKLSVGSGTAAPVLEMTDVMAAEGVTVYAT